MVRIQKVFSSIAVSFSLLLFCGFDADKGCDSEAPSDKTSREAQEQLSQMSNQKVGMPGITVFTEKKIMKRLYEMRDQNIATFTYLVDMNGHLHHVCDSMGYGLPYGTQFTNPEKANLMSSQGPNMTQSEPNGLFMPSSAEGTWVICASTQGAFTPMYIEPRVIVSPFRLKADNDYALPDETNEALKKTVTVAPYIPAVK